MDEIITTKDFLPIIRYIQKWLQDFPQDAEPDSDCYHLCEYVAWQMKDIFTTDRQKKTLEARFNKFRKKLLEAPLGYANGRQSWRITKPDGTKEWILGCPNEEQTLILGQWWVDQDCLIEFALDDLLDMEPIDHIFEQDMIPKFEVDHD